MYVVIFDGCDASELVQPNTVQTLEQAFAQIMCRCGLAYGFEQIQEGWKLYFTDVERPDRSPDPILSDYKKPRDARHDLIAQAVDGRIRGHVAIAAEDFQRSRIMRNASGTRLHVG